MSIEQQNISTMQTCSDNKVVLVQRTLREAKAVYPSDSMRNFNYSLSHPVKVSEEKNRKSNAFKFLPQPFKQESCAVAVKLRDATVNLDQYNDIHGAQVLQLFGYVQHTTEPTHNAGHILDLVITRSDTDVSDVDSTCRRHAV